MTTPQEARHAAYRSMAGGTVGTYNEDLIAASEVVTGLTGLGVNGQEIAMLQVLTGSDQVSLGGLQAAYAAQIGVSNWAAVDTLPVFALGFNTGRTTLPSTVTFARASDGTYRDNTGTRQTASTNIPRFDHTTAGAALGLLIEEQRITNFLNSAAPVTQTSASLGTGDYTLWVEGSGSVAVAANTATITGAGTATDGTPVTFAVTGAGTVDYTVTGPPDITQSENGLFETSYIITAGTPATREPDLAEITGTAFSDWYNNTEGTLVINAIPHDLTDTASQHLISLNDNTFNEVIRILFNSGNVTGVVTDGGAGQVSLSDTIAAEVNVAFAVKLNDFGFCVNGGTVQTDTSGTMPTLTMADIGRNSNGFPINSQIGSIVYYNTRLSDDQIQRRTA